MKSLLPRQTLILGGASSGKSAYAEGLLQGIDPASRHYLATAQAFDAEMATKIAAHRAARGTGWVTHEAPEAVAPVLDALQPSDTLLLDCATMWLSNVMLAERDLDAACAEFLTALGRTQARSVVVSNEVGHGVVPEYALGRRFREAQGRLNQALAAQAQLCVFVTAGLPQVLKGTLP